MVPLSGMKAPVFQEAMALIRPDGRAKTGRYLAEGDDLVRQALASPSRLHAVFALTKTAEELRAACLERQVPLYTASAGLIAKLVGTGYETAVSVVAVVGQRLIAESELPVDSDALLLVGEHIQDPRNVGVLVRTAEAAGCSAFVLSGDSAEPFSRAAVRSTTGSILRLPLCIAPDLPAALARLRDRGARIVATSARAASSVYDLPLEGGPLALVVGNETVGISPELRESATDFVSLPMAPDGASSLNVTVAAGVLLYEAIRQRHAYAHK